MRKSGFLATIATGVALLGAAITGMTSIDQELARSAAVEVTPQAAPPAYRELEGPRAPHLRAPLERRRHGDCAWRQRKERS
jgi:hypothetical protein